MMLGRLGRALALLPLVVAPANAAGPKQAGEGPVAPGGAPGQTAGEPVAADVTLPGRADLATEIRDRDSGMRVALRLSGSKAVPSSQHARERTRVYEGAAPHSGDVVIERTRFGAEDFVRFATKPPREALEYRIDVSRAAGLRLVENVLELVDEAGTPRLRMAAPYVVDRRGARVDARVSLDDCDADVSGRAPWGRPVTAPGRRECRVTVSWENGALEYPAVVDPSWTSTKSNMISPRSSHTATLLPDGRVLIVGGESVAGKTYLQSAELFDPKTNTFAATGSMSEARSEHVAVGFSDGSVIVAAGRNAAGPLSSTELYDGGTFKKVDPQRNVRAQAAGTLIGNGSALVAGGVDGTGIVLTTTELFDPSTAKWTLAGSMTTKRIGHYVTTLTDGSALAVAGISTTTLADLNDAELFIPSTNKWSKTGSLTETRYDFGGATLTDGRVLVAGGHQASLGAPTAGAEIYDPKKGTWSKAGKLATARSELTLTALSNGLALAAGGAVRDSARAITAYSKSVEVYDPTTNTWSSLPDLAQPRYGHTATLLHDGRVLVAGGAADKGPLGTAELFTLDANGTACKTAASCASGFCVDGVCCEKACDTTCNACAKASTGKADGTCALALAGQDPHGDCKDDGAPSCKMDGLCDGKGACERYPSTSKCTPSACKTGGDCTSGFCADGICCDAACDGKCEACTSAKKGSGTDGTCGPIAKGTDPDADCGTLGTGVCKSTGTCDGSGACVAPTKGKACAAAKCADRVTLAAAAKCGAQGDCTPDTTDCTPFVCDAKAVACTTSCSTDADCATGAKCLDGLCAKSENGASCADAVECSSGFCVDGVCCDKACDGQCEACDDSGNEGTCKPIAGDPHGGRNACAGSGTCGGSCDGVVAQMCDYPHADRTCDGDTANTCKDGTETVNRCNGLGACVASPKDCAPFACDKAACKTSCTSDADCQTGVHCDTNGKCTPGIALGCTNEDTTMTVDGGTRSCAPYACDNGSCKTSCKSDSDCAGGATCASGKCHGGSSGGCGCTLTETGPGPGGLLFAALSILLSRLRRRRAMLH